MNHAQAQDSSFAGAEVFNCSVFADLALSSRARDCTYLHLLCVSCLWSCADLALARRADLRARARARREICCRVCTRPVRRFGLVLCVYVLAFTLGFRAV